MKTLHLNLKRKWFDMILSGEKKEEYREVKNSMISLLFNWKRIGNTRDYLKDSLIYDNDFTLGWSVLKDFNTITFSNGYSKNRDQFEIEIDSIEINYGNTDWGAKEGEKYFVLKLGEIKSYTNQGIAT